MREGRHIKKKYFKLTEKLQQQYKKFPYTRLRDPIQISPPVSMSLLAKGSKPGAQIVLVSSVSFNPAQFLQSPLTWPLRPSYFWGLQESYFTQCVSIGICVLFLPDQIGVIHLSQEYHWNNAVLTLQPSGNAKFRVWPLTDEVNFVHLGKAARFLHSKATNIYFSQGASEMKY